MFSLVLSENRLEKVTRGGRGHILLYLSPLLFFFLERHFKNTLITGSGQGIKRFLQDDNNCSPQKVLKITQQSIDGMFFANKCACTLGAQLKTLNESSAQYQLLFVMQIPLDGLGEPAGSVSADVFAPPEFTQRDLLREFYQNMFSLQTFRLSLG